MIIPILVFLLSASGVLAYFTAKADFSNKVSAPEFKLTFSNGNTLATSSNLSGGASDTQYFTTDTVSHESEKIVPGDTLTIYGILNNESEIDAYTILQFKLYITKSNLNEVCVENLLYTFNNSNLISVTFNNSTKKFTDANIIVADSNKEFTLNYTFNSSTYDNSYKNASCRYEIKAYGVQATNLETGDNETLAQCATNILINMIGNNGNVLQLYTNEYQELEYIESSGTQYINTGLTNLFNGYSCKLKFKLLSNATQILIGTQYTENTSGKRNMFFVNNGVFKIGIGANEFNTVPFYTNVLYNSEISTENNYYVDINRENIYGTITDNDRGLNQIKLFCGDSKINNVVVPYYFAYMQLYKAKIYNNNILVRDFIPCYRKSDNEIGMFDTINGVFYTNQGSGNFIAGSNV